MALTVLKDGLTEHPDSEDIVIALQKLMREQKEYERAKEVLEDTLAKYPTERIWMQAVQLRRETGDL